MVKARIRIAPDGMLSGQARGLPSGEHDAEITVRDTAKPSGQADSATLLARVRAIQAELSRLQVLDPRSPDEIIGYGETGHFS